MESTKEKKITIMHACHWNLFREGVRQALERKEDIVYIGEATNGQELLNLLETRQPEVIILDISMPIMDGIQTLPIIKQKFPLVKVIMLTLDTDPNIIIRTLELGASAYLTVNAEAGEIYNTIKSCFGPGIHFSKSARKSLDPQFESLTARKIKIIRLMANSATEEKIAQELGSPVRIVKAQIRDLLRTAKVTTIEELVIKASLMGFIES